MLTREYLESLMKEPFLSEESEEEPLMTRERLAYVMKELLLSGISSSALQTTVVLNLGIQGPAPQMTVRAVPLTA